VARAAHVTESGDAVAVVSPISGRVTAQHAVLGAFIGPDTELFRVAADGSVQIEAAITAPDTRRIGPGDQATIIPRSGPPVSATVRSVTPTVSAGSQSATAILIPDAATSNLVIGEGVQVRLRGRSSGERGRARFLKRLFRVWMAGTWFLSAPQTALRPGRCWSACAAVESPKS
jgi:cobalt-zinc-cadmium efflux system membrane fusion protein